MQTKPSFLSENTQIIKKSLEQSDINVIKVMFIFTSTNHRIAKVNPILLLSTCST